MSETPDEKPKAEVAKKVIAAKRKYFVPTYGREVEADTPQDAAEVVNEEIEEDKNDADDGER